ncbi:putative IS66 family transposase ISPre3 [Hollandina sp. SP2]
MQKVAQCHTKEPKSLFILRISLDAISPQIWRRVQVPGYFTLGDLHRVIQDSMGWDNDHLHAFTLHTMQYGPVSLVDDLDMHDEDEYILDDLGLRDKQRFQYTYDFGDTWQHQILVSKIIPIAGCSDADKQYARCLSGKRACPPEDSGGPGGYEELLETLKASVTYKQQLPEWLAWLRDFDPDYFSLDEVNGLLCPGIQRS